MTETPKDIRKYVSMSLKLSPVNEEWLRSQNRRKGDMSNIVNGLLDKARNSAALP
jgi:predicted FMN-binding regulatory protein PaiB